MSKQQNALFLGFPIKNKNLSSIRFMVILNLSCSHITSLIKIISGIFESECKKKIDLNTFFSSALQRHTVRPYSYHKY